MDSRTPVWRRKRFDFKPNSADITYIAMAEAKRWRRAARNKRIASK